MFDAWFIASSSPRAKEARIGKTATPKAAELVDGLQVHDNLVRMRKIADSNFLKEKGDVLVIFFAGCASQDEDLLYTATFDFLIF